MKLQCNVFLLEGCFANKNFIEKRHIVQYNQDIMLLLIGFEGAVTEEQ